MAMVKWAFLLLFLYLIGPFWYTSVAYQANLVEQWLSVRILQDVVSGNNSETKRAWYVAERVPRW